MLVPDGAMSGSEQETGPSSRHSEAIGNRQPLGQKGMRGVSFKVLIVDDNALIRRCLRSLIEREPEWKVCGEAVNGQEAVEKVKELHPDAVVLDWQMPVMDGIEAAREIGRIAPRTRMVMVSLHAGAYLSRMARAVGIQDVLSKTDALRIRLLSALRNVCSRKNDDAEQRAF